jgi:CRP/FNR family cyclic AMP-dependent transcriptional regulator
MSSINNLRDFLLFQELAEDEMMRLTQLFSTEAEDFMPGSIICQKDAPGDSMYLIKSGKVQISLPTDQGDVVLAELGPGKFFGEMSLLDKAPRSANVNAVESTELYILTRKHIAFLMDKEARIAAKMMLAMSRILSARIRVMDDRIQDSFATE